MTRRAGLDKAAVVEEAARLIDEEGIEQLSLGRLAERLGVRTPSLYNHVAGLPGLKRDLTVYCLRELIGPLTRAVIGKARAEAIFALFDAYLAYAREKPGRYLLTLQAPPPDDKEWRQLGEQALDIVRAILEPYRLDEEATIHAIRGLRVIIRGAVEMEMAGAFAMPISLDDSFHWLVDLFIKGLEQHASTVSYENH
jgi:AcrR family transcriptional regulator